MSARLALFTLSLLALSSSIDAATQLGAKPAEIESTYKTEREWAIGETVADVGKMVTRATGRTRPVTSAVSIAFPWDPDLLTPFVVEWLGPPDTRRHGDVDFPQYFTRLMALTAVGLVDASAEISAALAKDIRDPKAHEAAALTLGAFGLREAGRMSDVRWTMNRMTAHLAMAAALRNDEGPGIDGQLARAILLTLSNRQAKALIALAELEEGTPRTVLKAWTRALRMRITQDWRLLPSPDAATRLEKLEYLRARRAAVGSQRADADLVSMNEPPAADLGRIIRSHVTSVQDGNTYVLPALEYELGELNDISLRMRRRPLDSDLENTLNQRAGHLITANDVSVLSWGAWAEFFQRTIGAHLSEYDHHVRWTWGATERADVDKIKFDAVLSRLMLFPVASVMRNKGKKGTEADMQYLSQAITLAIQRPEVVPFEYWSRLEMGTHYEMVPRGMPVGAKWFMKPTPELPFDAGRRTWSGGHGMPVAALESLVSAAPYDSWLLTMALMPRPTDPAFRRRIWDMAHDRLNYDLRILNPAINWAPTKEARVELQRQACSLAVNECLELASLLVFYGQENAAIGEYERAFVNPALDAVTRANNSSWLVWYYENHNQVDRALALAKEAADTGSARGLGTLAGLYERMGRIDEAGILYREEFTHYGNAGSLAGFLYRQAVVRGRMAFKSEWALRSKELFPNGLQPVPIAMPDQPSTGVFVYNDSYQSRDVGVRAGDIIVGLDGWRVDSREQFYAVDRFDTSAPKMKLTVWRGVLFTVEVNATGDLGMDLQTHPLTGWIQ